MRLCAIGVRLFAGYEKSKSTLQNQPAEHVRELSQGFAMSQIAPPMPPLVDLRDQPPAHRVRNHLLQIALAGATIYGTVWCYELHILLGLTATFLAKHVLVALLAAGLRLPIREIKS